MSDDRPSSRNSSQSRDAVRPMSLEDILMKRPRRPAPEGVEESSPSAAKEAKDGDDWENDEIEVAPPPRLAGGAAAGDPRQVDRGADEEEPEYEGEIIDDPVPADDSSEGKLSAQDEEKLQRHLLRRWALQLLYALHQNPMPVEEEDERMLVFPGEDLDNPEDVMPPRWDYRETARQLADHAYRERVAFDEKVSARLKKWRIDRLTTVDRLILHLGLAELSRPEGPSARVILNEWIEVAKDFGTAKSAGFVNGVLDALARELRPGQLKARDGKKSK